MFLWWNLRGVYFWITPHVNPFPTKFNYFIPILQIFQNFNKMSWTKIVHCIITKIQTSFNNKGLLSPSPQNKSLVTDVMLLLHEMSLNQLYQENWIIYNLCWNFSQKNNKFLFLLPTNCFKSSGSKLPGGYGSKFVEFDTQFILFLIFNENLNFLRTVKSFIMSIIIILFWVN